jgi:uncharacterized iron-regulated membrane protein
MRTAHRWIMTVALIFIAYWIGSGLVMQSYDMLDSSYAWSGDGGDRYVAWARAREQPIDESIAADAFTRAATAAQTASPNSTLTALELRVDEGASRVLVDLGGTARRRLGFDALTGKPIQLSLSDDPGLSPGEATAGTVMHNAIKNFHRGNALGDVGIIGAPLAATALGLLVITGLVLYARLLAARQRSNRSGLFWRGAQETAWRAGHRWVSIIAAVFVLNTSVTGMFLTYDNLRLRFFDPEFSRMMASIDAKRGEASPTDAPGMGSSPGADPNVTNPNAIDPLIPSPGGAIPPANSQPIDANELPALLRTTLSAAHKAEPSAAITSIKIGTANQQPRGLVVFATPGPLQRAYDARTGAKLAAPADRLPWHQILKATHRGDIFGYWGRYVMALSGLSALFLVISGAMMYAQLWSTRSERGRRGIFWV